MSDPVKYPSSAGCIAISCIKQAPLHVGVMVLNQYLLEGLEEAIREGVHDEEVAIHSIVNDNITGSDPAAIMKINSMLESQIGVLTQICKLYVQLQTFVRIESDRKVRAGHMTDLSQFETLFISPTSIYASEILALKFLFRHADPTA